MLDEVRKARNDFAHRGLVPTIDIATKAIKGFFELASMCVSDFKQTDVFDRVVSIVVEHCNPELYPNKTKLEASEVSHWIPIPPLPGDTEWGDKPFEIIDELTLKPLKKGKLSQ
jgi:hypothetical protein